MNSMSNFGRRQGDNMETKLLRVAALLGAMGTIAFFGSNVGGIKFVDKETNSKEHQEIKSDIQKDKDAITEMKVDIKYIKEGITELKNRP